MCSNEVWLVIMAHAKPGATKVAIIANKTTCATRRFQMRLIGADYSSHNSASQKPDDGHPSRCRAQAPSPPNLAELYRAKVADCNAS